jgi:glycosyltransferase involved in cell wall biosynthesis
MKVLIVSSLYPPHVVGGAEKMAALLAEAHFQHGHEVVVITLHPESEEVVEVRNGVRVYRLPLENFYWPFGRKEKTNQLYRLAWHIREMWNSRAALRIAKILDAESPDIVNTHNVCGFSVAVWREVKKRGIRLVHTVHDYYLMCPRCTLFRKGRNCKERCWSCKVLTFNRKSLSRLPDSVVSVSQHALEEHVRRRYFEDVPATVIYNIQDTMQPPSQAPNQGASPKDLVFGFIGRIEEEKGIETLLLATNQLHQPNWKLRIAGRGVESYVRGLTERFADARIEWVGFTDAWNFYSSVDVVIIPSLWAEPLPYVCVEAVHAGKSLICASSGGIPEIAKLAHTVEFFQPGNAGALAEKMNAALSSPQRWRERALPETSVLRPFRKDEVVARYLREYIAPSEASPVAQREEGY